MIFLCIFQIFFIYIYDERLILMGTVLFACRSKSKNPPGQFWFAENLAPYALKNKMLLNLDLTKNEPFIKIQFLSL